MFRNKTQVDAHVSNVIRSLKSKNEVSFRGFQIAKLYSDVKEYEKAIEYLEDYLKVRTNDNKAYEFLGQLHERLSGQYNPKSFDAYNKAYMLNNQNNNALIKICEHICEKDDVDSKSAWYWVEKLQTSQLSSHLLSKLKGKIKKKLLEKDDKTDIVKIYETKIKISPENLDDRLVLLQAYMESKRATKILELLAETMQTAKIHQSYRNTEWLQSAVSALEEIKETSSPNQTSVQYYYTYHLILLILATIKTCPDTKEPLKLFFKLDRWVDEGKIDSKLLKEVQTQVVFIAGLLILNMSFKEHMLWKQSADAAYACFLASCSQAEFQTKGQGAPGVNGNLLKEINALSCLRFSQAGHMVRTQCDKELDTDTWVSKLHDNYSNEKVCGLLYGEGESLECSYLVKSDMFSADVIVPSLASLQHYDHRVQRWLKDDLTSFVWIALNSSMWQRECINLCQLGFLSKLPYSCSFLDDTSHKTISLLDVQSFMLAAVYCIKMYQEDMGEVKDPLQPVLLPLPFITINKLHTDWWNALYFLYNFDGQSYEKINESRMTLQAGLKAIRCDMPLAALVHVAQGLSMQEESNTARTYEQSNQLSERCSHYWDLAIQAIQKSLLTQTPIRNLSGDFFGLPLSTVESEEQLKQWLEEGLIRRANKLQKQGDFKDALDTIANLNSPRSLFNIAMIHKKIFQEDFSAHHLDTALEILQQASNLVQNVQDSKILELKAEVTKQMHLTKEELKALKNGSAFDVSVTHLSHTTKFSPSKFNNSISSQKSLHNSQKEKKYLNNVDAQRNISNNNMYARQPVQMLFQDEPQNLFTSTPHPTRHTHAAPTEKHADINFAERLVAVECKLSYTEEKVQKLEQKLQEAEKKYESDSKEKFEKLEMRLLELQSYYQSDYRKLSEQIQLVDASNKMQSSYITDPASFLMQSYSRCSRLPAPMTHTPLPFNNQLFYNEVLRTPPPPVVMPSIPTIDPIYYDQSKSFEAGYFNINTTPSITSIANTIASTAPSQLSQLLSKNESPIKSLSSQQPTINFNPKTTTQTKVQPTFTTKQQPTPTSKQQPTPSSKQQSSSKSTALITQTATPSKSVIGGITFSKDPIVKEVKEEKKKPPTAVSSAQNVFSNFSFFSKSTQSLSSAPSATPTSSIFTSNTSLNKSNNNQGGSAGDVVEEYEPTVDFTPIVSLPLVTVVTGEEDDEKVFGERAKVYRMDGNQWKERGIGEFKILRSKVSGKFRILMRREQVLKVCLNHYIDTSMKMVTLKSSENSYCWFAKDYSDMDVKMEQLCVKFKTKEIAEKFKNAFDSCVEKLKSLDLSTSSNKDDSQISMQKDKAIEKKEDATKEAPSLSELFKKKEGDWECDACYVNNPGNQSKCLSCETPKPGSTVVTTESKTSSNAPSFKFGAQGGFTFGQNSGFTSNFGSQSGFGNVSASTTTTTSQPVGGFTSKLVTPSQTGSTFGSFTSSFGGFSSFGQPTTKTTTSSLFSSTNTVTTTSSLFASVSTTKTTTPSLFFSTADSTKTTTSSLFSNNSSFFSSKTSSSVFSNPTNNGITSKAFTFSPSEAMKKSVFNDINKTPVKSPQNLATSPQSPGDDMYKNTEGEDDHILFEPIVKLPDNYDLKTGEEDENVMFCKRAKLYRFVASEWKERGVGEMKVLKHKVTGQSRLLMRREQVLKPCCNHLLLEGMKLAEMPQAPKKAWVWYAMDASEEEAVVSQLCIRFSNEDYATEFKNVFENAVADAQSKGDVSAGVAKLSVESSDDCVITAIDEADSTLQQKSQKFKLPKNFYMQQKPCPGCIGCNPDEFDFSTIGKKSNNTPKGDSESGAALNLSKSPIFQAPTFVPPASTKEAVISTTNSLFPSSFLFNKPTASFSFPTTICSPSSVNKSTASSATNIFSSFSTSTTTSLFNTNIFATNKTTNIFAPSTTASINIFAASTTSINIFGTPTTNATNIPSSTPTKTTSKPLSSNLFSTNVNTNSNLFTSTTSNNIFATPPSPTTASLFPSGTFNKATTSTSSLPVFGSSFGVAKTMSTTTTSVTSTTSSTIFGSKTDVLDFASLSSSTQPAFKEDKHFKWAGAGQMVFASKKGGSKEGTSGKDDDLHHDVEAEPDVHFEPIISLPEVVDLRTGEEGEEVLFKEMAKLFAFKNPEWKERGHGDMKVLLDKTNGTVRLLLRRYQVHKVACNHSLTKSQNFVNLASNEKTWCWFANDFSDGVLAVAQLAVRFKTPELSKKFKDVIDMCQQNMDGSNKLSQSFIATLSDTPSKPNGNVLESSEKVNEKKAVNDVIKIEPVNNGKDENSVKTNINNMSNSLVEYNDGDDDENKDDDDYGEEQVLFEKRATLVYNDPEPQEIGQVVVSVVEDLDVPGWRVRMETDDTDLVCNHIICRGYSIRKLEDQRNTCSWDGKDYSTDEPVRKTFFVTFSSTHSLVEFLEIFNRGVEIAEENDVGENAQDEYSYG